MFVRLLGLMAVMASMGSLAHAQSAPAAATGAKAGSATVLASPTAVKVAAVTEVSQTSAEAYKAVEQKTRAALAGVVPTGDADVDFLRLVMPYQKAISELATAALKYSTDAQVRMMAGDLVKQEEASLRTAKEWMAKHGPMGEPAAAAVKEELPVATSSSVVPLTPMTKAASEKKSVTMTELLGVSKTAPALPGVPVSSSVPAVSPSLPPVDVISPTHATVMPDGMPAAMTPGMPAPDAEIVNVAPKMEFLDAAVPVVKN